MSELDVIVPSEERIAGLEIVHAGQAKELIEGANSFEIKNDEDLGRAADFTNKVNAIFKEIESQRDGYTRPLFEGQRLFNAHFQVITKPLKAAEDRLRGMMTSYRQHQKREQQAEAARIRKEQAVKEKAARKAGEPPPPPPPPPQDTPIMGDLGGKAQYREKWEYELTDITEVPLKYLQVNPAMVKTAIGDGVRDIPGLRIFDAGNIKTR